MKSFEEKLEQASAGWVDAGVITAGQQVEILRRHPVVAGGSTRFIAIVATIGGLLFAVGVSLLIKSNWAAIGDWTKIVGLVALLVSAYAAGWKLTCGAHRSAIGEVCLMVGGIFFLCGIALVSQIFHLNSRPANGVLLWWVGIAAVPWLTRAKGAQFLCVVAALVWFGMEMATPGSWIEVGARARGTAHDWPFFAANFVVLGVALWLSGLALRGTRWETFAGLHEKWGIVVTGAALYWLGFLRHDWKNRWEHVAGVDRSTWLALAVGLGLVAAAALAAGRAARPAFRALGPWLALALIAPLGVAAIPASTDAGWLWSVVAWIALFALSIAVVRVGLETGREGWVNLGILFVAANIITRYFDLFGTLLEGGVFFILTGVLVTTLGIYLERKRRSLLADLRREVVS